MTIKIPTKDKIVTASIELFYKNSYANTTLQDISKTSGVTIGSIYHTFPEGKKDIANQILENYLAENSKSLGEILKTNAIHSKLEQIIDKVIELMKALGNKYPCLYDNTFGLQLGEGNLKFEKLKTEIIEYTAIMIQLKNTDISEKEASLKAKTCYTIWDSLLYEYEKTQDMQILEQIKIVTLKYLQA
jgi:AcrR family transcriptional regulator